jgi:hypothetical protein
MQPATLKAALFFATAVAFAIACAYVSPDFVLTPTPGLLPFGDLRLLAASVEPQL